jgi:hypothetical protein
MNAVRWYLWKRKYRAKERRKQREVARKARRAKYLVACPERSLAQMMVLGKEPRE